jgi:hypothetical protein
MTKSPEHAKERRSGHRTHRAAQLAVASELRKRGYEVAFTMGNATPLADLMVVSPALKSNFLIDVKGLYKPNSWPIREKLSIDSRLAAGLRNRQMVSGKPNSLSFE